MSTFGKVVKAEEHVPRGTVVSESGLAPVGTRGKNVVDYVTGMDGQQILLQSMTTVNTDDVDHPVLVWGPFKVKTYEHDDVTGSICFMDLLWDHKQCEVGTTICVTLEPVPAANKTSSSKQDKKAYLTHDWDESDQMTVENGEEECRRIVELKMAEGPDETDDGKRTDEGDDDSDNGESVFSFRFVAWDSEYDSQSDHVGMNPDGTPVTMLDGSTRVQQMYQWKLVKEVTPEPTAEPTVPTPTTTPPTNPPVVHTSEPAAIIDDHHNHSSAGSSSSSPSLPTGAIIGIVAGVAVLLMVLGFTASLFTRRQQKNRRPTTTTTTIGSRRSNNTAVVHDDQVELLTLETPLADNEEEEEKNDSAGDGPSDSVPVEVQPAPVITDVVHKRRGTMPPASEQEQPVAVEAAAFSDL